MNKKNDQDNKSKLILDRVDLDSQSLLGSSMEKVLTKSRSHLSAQDVDQKDQIEMWATRVGRALSVLFFIFLCAYLVMTYGS